MPVMLTGMHRKLLPEQIVAGVFGTLGLVTYLSTRGGKGDPLAVPLNATSKEQEGALKRLKSTHRC